MTTDRRKFNFNLMITAILLFLFGIIMYNQRLILNMNGKIEDMNKKIDQYFLPILDIEPTEWENNH
jgi:cell division protein FtsL